MSESTDATTKALMARFAAQGRPFVLSETLTDALTDVLERHSDEVGSSKSPEVLAAFLVSALAAFVRASEPPPPRSAVT